MYFLALRCQNVYIITNYKNYKPLKDYDKKNVFDIEECTKRKVKVKLNIKTIFTTL